MLIKKLDWNMFELTLTGREVRRLGDLASLNASGQEMAVLRLVVAVLFEKQKTRLNDRGR